MLNRKNEKNLLIGVFILAIILLTLPYILRYIGGNNTLIGEQVYFHSQIPGDSLQYEDELILGERQISITPYHMLLNLSSKIMGIHNSSMFIPLLLGIASLLLVYLILKKIKIDLISRFAIVIVLMLSPAFIYCYTLSNPHCLALFLTLAGILCFLQEKKIYFFSAIACFSILALFSIFNILIVILFLLTYCIIKKQKNTNTILLILALIALSFIFSPGFFIHYEVPIHNLFETFFTDLGAKIGFGMFSVFLLIAGLFFEWEHKKKLYPIYLIVVLVLFSTYFLKDVACIYLNFLAAYFIGKAVIRIIKRKWELGLIKNLSLLIIICGLLFSSISYANRLSNNEPSAQMIESFEWLEENSFEEEIVASHPKNGAYLASFGKKIILDSYMHENRKTKRFEDIDRLFHSTNLDEAKQIIRDYEITYIYIDKNMKKELWKGNKELIFLLGNKQTFENIYKTEEVEIWKFIG